jgi:26S proteasome regulatory subunit N6
VWLNSLNFRSVRTLIDLVAKVPNSDQFQAELCRECIEWCKVEKRTFLRQRIEARLAALLLAGSDFKAALKLLEGLLREVKKLDDKLLLVELHLLESKIHQGVKNFPKAKVLHWDS